MINPKTTENDIQETLERICRIGRGLLH
jgi:hypothetical protein